MICQRSRRVCCRVPHIRSALLCATTFQNDFIRSIVRRHGEWCGNVPSPSEKRYKKWRGLTCCHRQIFDFIMLYVLEDQRAEVSAVLTETTSSPAKNTARDRSAQFTTKTDYCLLEHIEQQGMIATHQTADGSTALRTFKANSNCSACGAL